MVKFKMTDINTKKIVVLTTNYFTEHFIGFISKDFVNT